MQTAEELIFELDQIRIAHNLSGRKLCSAASLNRDIWSHAYNRKNCKLKTFIRCAQVLGYKVMLVKEKT